METPKQEEGVEREVTNPLEGIHDLLERHVPGVEHRDVHRYEELVRMADSAIEPLLTTITPSIQRAVERGRNSTHLDMSPIVEIRKALNDSAKQNGFNPSEDRDDFLDLVATRLNDKFQENELNVRAHVVVSREYDKDGNEITRREEWTPEAYTSTADSIVLSW